MLLHPWAAALEGAATTCPLPGPQFPSPDNRLSFPHLTTSLGRGAGLQYYLPWVPT